MPSEADTFEANFEFLKEFVDDKGRQLYLIHFKDGSELIFTKVPSRDSRSIAEFVIRDQSTGGKMAHTFEDNFGSLKEFVDDQGHHFYVIQFNDDSGRIFRKRLSEDSHSIAEFIIRSRFAMEGMRMIASATDFEVDAEKNTQQNLRNLMKG